MVHHDIQATMRRHLPLRVLTDSSGFFYVVVKDTTTTEKRLMLDLRATREAFERNDITEREWIRRKLNLGDGFLLTKVKPSPPPLPGHHTLSNSYVYFIRFLLPSK